VLASVNNDFLQGFSEGRLAAAAQADRAHDGQRQALQARAQEQAA
jgi:hypothetical protein